ncbi:MAG TPA: SMI1/KNR4 family protein [Thermoanaerobaculia bacterium]|nr:SMI1/KNR4 family protein [Thermoanaerobaculia bacterium]
MSASEAVDEALARLVESGLVPVDGLAGCSEEEIGRFESALGAPLPAAYRRFLARAGRSAGDFMVGSDLHYPGLLKLRAAADELLEDDGTPFRLGPHQVVFLMHQGYQFLFLDDAGGDDPAVHHYLEGEEPNRVCNSFSEWLRIAVEDEIEAAEAARGS